MHHVSYLNPAIPPFVYPSNFVCTKLIGSLQLVRFNVELEVELEVGQLKLNFNFNTKGGIPSNYVCIPQPRFSFGTGPPTWTPTQFLAPYSVKGQDFFDTC